MIRKVSPAGLVSTFAGTAGISGYLDGQGSAAKLNAPHGVAVDAAGSVYVADTNNHVIRVVLPSGQVSTFAGVAGTPGPLDGLSSSAMFNSPYGVAVDAAGNVFVADRDNFIVRKVSITLSLPLCDSTWRHAALTYTATLPSSLSLFVDGALRSTSSVSVALLSPASSTLRIGWGGDLSVNSGSLFAGSLAELRIYSRALSVAEVVALSQPPFAGYAALSITPLSLLSPGSTIYNFVCAAGYIGSPSALMRSSFDGSWAFTSAPQCTPCAAGSTSVAGAAACTPCYPGTYSLAGAASCTLCPSGTYGGAAGLSSAACSGFCNACPPGSVFPPLASSMSCASNGARSVPAPLGLLLWPGAHPANAAKVDVIVAPLAQCAQLSSSAACAAAASIAGADGIVRYVVGTAAALHLEAAEELACTAQYPSPSVSPSALATASASVTRSSLPSSAASASPSASARASLSVSSSPTGSASAHASLAPRKFTALPPGAGNGLNAQVRAVCTYNSLVVYGGDFTALGSGTTAANVAAWNPSTSSWLTFGSFTGGAVQSCLQLDTKLVVATAVGAVHTWDGALWAPLGTLNTGASINALVQFGGLLVAAGTHSIQHWSGSTWSTIGSHAGFTSAAAIIFQGYLFVGGSFQPSTTWPCALVAKYDGSSWSCNAGPLGPAVNQHLNYVLALGLHGGSLYAAGFLTIGQNIYSMSSPTGTWVVLAPTAGGDVNFLLEFRGLLYMGAWSSGAIFVLDDSSNSLAVVGGSGLGGRIATKAAVLNDVLYIGGDFSSIGVSGESAKHAVSYA
jgi:hypothetical protein